MIHAGMAPENWCPWCEKETIKRKKCRVCHRIFSFNIFEDEKKKYKKSVLPLTKEALPTHIAKEFRQEEEFTIMECLKNITNSYIEDFKLAS